jgi:hypothetical protein
MLGAIITNPYSGTLEATSLVKTGGTGIQYLMADGSTLTQSASGGNSNVYLYTSKNGAGGPPTPSGTIEYNNAVQGSATVIWISPTTRDGINIEVFFSFITTISQIYLQDQLLSTNYIKYSVTGVPTPIAGTTGIAIPVVAASSGGTGATSFGPDRDIMMSIFTDTLEVDTRLSTVESDTQNQSAVPGITTFSGTVSAGAITKVSTLYGAPGSDMAIGGIGNNVTVSDDNIVRRSRDDKIVRR